MNKVLKHALLLTVIGFVAGIGVGIGFLLIFSEAGINEVNSVSYMIVYFAACALLGAISMGSSAIYDIESWSITKCTVTHYLIVMVTLIAHGFAVGWIYAGATMIVIMLVADTVAYFIIWLIQSITYKRKVDLMNMELNEWKTKNKVDKE